MILLSTGLVGVLTLASAAPAAACSCIPFDEARFDGANGAVVATVTGMRTRLSGLVTGDNVWRLEVEHDLKSNVGPEVYVWGRRGPGPDCGVALRAGDRRGFFLARDGARWRIGGCSIVSPETILGLAAESAEPHTGYDRLPAEGAQPVLLFGLASAAAALGTIGVNRRQSG